MYFSNTQISVVRTDSDFFSNPQSAFFENSEVMPLTVREIRLRYLKSLRIHSRLSLQSMSFFTRLIIFLSFFRALCRTTGNIGKYCPDLSITLCGLFSVGQSGIIRYGEYIFCLFYQFIRIRPAHPVTGSNTEIRPVFPVISGRHQNLISVTQYQRPVGYFFPFILIFYVL